METLTLPLIQVQLSTEQSDESSGRPPLLDRTSIFVRHLVEILSWIITSSLLLNVKVKLLSEKSTRMFPFLILASEAPYLTFGQCPKENISPPGRLP